jgi:hypothetical protein
MNVSTIGDIVVILIGFVYIYILQNKLRRLKFRLQMEKDGYRALNTLYHSKFASDARHINFLCEMIHDLNAKWWIDLETGLRLERNVGELLMLTVSELSEAMEGHRKNLMDDKLPHRKDV